MLNFGSDAIVINSFSKYFCMPGWRLGWVIIPESLNKNFLKLSQNLFISSGNIAQFSAIKVFECIDELDRLVKCYHKTRDEAGKILLEIPSINLSMPSGAFYFYLDISKTKSNSFELVNKLMDETGIVLTPGLDFDQNTVKGLLDYLFHQNQNMYLRLQTDFMIGLKKLLIPPTLSLFLLFLSFFWRDIYIMDLFIF